jgi:hypothetical protein
MLSAKGGAAQRRLKCLGSQGAESSRLLKIYVGFSSEFGQVFGNQRSSLMFAPLAEFFDPFFGHRRKIGTIPDILVTRPCDVDRLQIHELLARHIRI